LRHRERRNLPDAPAKRKTIEKLAEYFCLRPIDLANLSGLKERSARKNLYELWLEGRENNHPVILNREPYFDLKTEARSYVYGLSDYAVKRFGGKSFDDHSPRTLDHELEITWFHMAVKQLGEKQGWELYWQQTGLKTSAIHPDAYFALTDPQKPAGKNTYHFFLEVERSKIGHYREGEPSIVRKLNQYYDLFDTPQSEKDWRFRQFRVIVIQRTEERCRNLCHAFPEKCRHRMFWLTTEPAYQQDISGSIFLTPKDYESASYGLSAIF
jgi:hypothetical protein